MKPPPLPRAVIVLVVAVCFLPLVWPGDAPWINDEPMLVLKALDANSHGRLATESLYGSLGNGESSIRYGPFGVWVYQLFLLVTHNAVAMVAMRAALTTGVTAFSLLWLARTLRLWPWFVPVVLLSPYLWFYSRLMWDNTFCIPVTALVLAGYAAYLVHGSSAGLRIAVAGLLVLPLIHLMSLAFLVPVGVHLILCERRGLLRHRFSIGAMIAVAAAAGWPYWRYLAAGQFATSGAGDALPGWWFPMLGGRFLTASGLGYFFGDAWLDGIHGAAGAAFNAARLFSFIAYPLTWTGMALAIGRLASTRGRPREARWRMAGIAVCVWAAQTVLNGLSRTYGHPHYYNATWACYVLFAWLIVDELARRRLAAPVVGLLSASLAAVLIGLMVRVHETGGTRSLRYGPTIGAQRDVVSALLKHPRGTEIQTNVLHFARFPYAMRVLRELAPQTPETLPPSKVLIRYQSRDPLDGHIELVESPPGGNDAATTSRSTQ